MKTLALILALTVAGTLHAQETALDFGWIDVYVDSGAKKLAAYQVDLSAATGNVMIVGISGGEHPAFSKEPYYDKAAMRHDHVILAAFNTGNDLPTGRTRVARIMVSYRKGVHPTYRFTLTTAATVGGEKIPAVVSIQTGGAAE